MLMQNLGGQAKSIMVFSGVAYLVNTKTTIPLRVGEERWIYTSTLRVSVYIHHYSPPLRGIVVYYISQVLCALWLVDLAVHSLKYRPLDLAVCSPAQLNFYEIVLKIIFLYSQDISPFKSAFCSDILQIGPDIIYWLTIPWRR